jgi:choline dehydrogenase-like flavoprotein
MPNGVANFSGQVGKNLMDHPLYLAWALMPKPVFGYRGPLATSGIESTRDGDFRKKRAAFRIEIGNEGWNFPINDPYTTTVDFINGINQSGLNPIGEGQPQALFGPGLVNSLNDRLTRQFRLGFLVEQSPDSSNCVTLAAEKDHLNLPRPKIHYDISPYSRAGLGAAVEAADQIFSQLNARQFTTDPAPDDPSALEVPVNGKPKRIKFFGSGHIVGTYCMGTTKENSVVNSEQRSWDHPNLFLVGSGVFPTVATGNPTLTIAALSLWAAQTIKKDLA